VNFGESLAYWYFRLNGFMPLTNFVLHRPDPLHRHNADADLLAVRFPHVYEEVGGKQEDWDNDQFKKWGLDFRNVISLIVEIKTGRYSEESINRAFDERRVLYALRRLGVVNQEACEEISGELSRKGVVHYRAFSFAKILVSNSENAVGSCEKITPCCRIELQHTVDFIRSRMHRYRADKEVSRMFFSGDLIQFFAWEAGLSLVDDIPEV